MSVHVRFVVDKVALGQVSPPSTLQFPVSTIPPTLDTHLHLHVALSRTNRRSLRTFQKAMLFQKSGSIGQSFTVTFFPTTSTCHASVIRRPLTVEARVLSWASPCGICNTRSSTATGFSPSTPLFPCQYHSTNTPHSSSTIRVYYTYQDKWAKPGTFRKSNDLSEIGKHWTENYCHFFISCYKMLK